MPISTSSIPLSPAFSPFPLPCFCFCAGKRVIHSKDIQSPLYYLCKALKNASLFLDCDEYPSANFKKRKC
eukprot:g3450.t1